MELSLEELFAKADAIPDRRPAKEREKYRRRIAKAQADLAEVIGRPEVEA